MKLSRYHIALLEELSEDGGFTTDQVAQRIPSFGFNRHQQSSAARARLMELKQEGLVEFLDDQKPVCWVRTEKGTAVLGGAP